MLDRVRAQVSFVLQERNIDEDDDLHRRYLERIPVVVIDGEEAFELEIDEAALRDRLVRVER